MAIEPSRIVVPVLLACFVALLTQCGKVAYGIANLPSYIGAYERRADVRYGPASRQLLDVYVPSGSARRPVVVFWYGGMWVKGSKEQYRFVGAALANSGYVAVLPDYRLFPDGRFPQFIEDGALALKWVREHAAEIGGDPDAVFLMGHSAGAHLAATLALDGRYLRQVGGDPGWIRAWIGIAGPYALRTGYPPVLARIFGEPYIDADWMPVSLVNGHSPPAMLIHGTRDVLVLPREAADLEQKLSRAGVPVSCHMYDRSGHTDLVAAFSIPLRFEAVTLADVRRFIGRTLAGERIVAPCPEVRLRSAAGIASPPHT